MAEIKVEKSEKRKRGRPRKNPIENEPKVKRGRGRPKKKKLEIESIVEEVIETRIGKLVGYCPNCDKDLCTLDFDGKFYKCWSCQETCKKVNNEKQRDDHKNKYRSKREYLDDYLQVSEEYDTSSSTVVSGIGNSIIKKNNISEEDSEDIFD